MHHMSGQIHVIWLVNVSSMYIYIYISTIDPMMFTVPPHDLPHLTCRSGMAFLCQDKLDILQTKLQGLERVQMKAPGLGIVFFLVGTQQHHLSPFSV